MSQKPETLFKIRVVKQIEMIPNTWIFKTNELSIRGIPDIIGCTNGKFFAIELKARPKDKPTKLQEYILGLISNAGGYATVAHPDNFPKVIKDLCYLAQGGEANQPSQDSLPDTF